MFRNNRRSFDFFSVQSLAKNKNTVMFAEKITPHHDIPISNTIQNTVNGVRSKYKKLNQYSKDALNLVFATTQCLLTPSLIVPFFWGPIYTHLPHVRSGNLLGYLDFTGRDVDVFTKAAQKTSNGIATFWAGPFPVLYVTSNDARHVLVRESHVGIVDKAASEYLEWLSGGNNVMGTFPDFRPIDSETYQNQRRFLMRLFHSGTKLRLPTIEKVTSDFLQHYCEEQGKSPHPLRELITALVLRTSSHLLGITQVTLDKLYFEQPEFAQAIDAVAHYGISERANFALEEKLYEIFLHVLKKNFDTILAETQDTNLIRNIFASMGVEFPKVFEDFDKIPIDIQHALAMNFTATGFGAMVHSTVNTLDWAIARLLNDQNQLNALIELMAKHKDLDLTQENIFDKGGVLFPLCEWVLYNVFLYPPFSHEFFINRKSFKATLSDHSTIDVQSGSFIVVNYVQCNRSNKQMTSPETFSESLKGESTVGRFIIDPQVASFGGSINSKENRMSRICPGAKTSLYEQMIMIAILLRDYSLALTDSKEISYEVDASKYPLCTRLNEGNIVLTKNQPSANDNKKVLDPAMSSTQTDIQIPLDENVAISNETHIAKQKKYGHNKNGFFNRAKTALSLCDTNKAQKIVGTALTIGAAFAVHKLTV
ncbi:MAG: hypothetical protein H0W64_05030 [Gammaproteobacteria bacterium]|nr:hypothetical protein [Gammaproteobacteria bacterium]